MNAILPQRKGFADMRIYYGVRPGFATLDVRRVADIPHGPGRWFLSRRDAQTALDARS